MNKQEVIKEIREIYAIDSTTNHVIDLINQIDEPQKVVVPKFVAEWIDGTGKYGLFGANYDRVPDEIYDWIYHEESNAEKLHRAWLDGYTIEQEKLYTVEIPNPLLTKSSETVTVLRKFKDGILLTNVDARVNRKHIEIYQLTESEIRKDFDWAWQWAEEVKEIGK